MIVLSPLVESLAQAKSKALLKPLEEAFNAMIKAHQEESDAEDEEEEEKGEEEKGEEGSDDEEEPKHSFDFGLIAMAMFDIGAEPEIKDANRSILYKLSENLKAISKPFEGGHCCSGDHHDHDHLHGSHSEDDGEGSMEDGSEEEGSDAGEEEGSDE